MNSAQHQASQGPPHSPGNPSIALVEGRGALCGGEVNSDPAASKRAVVPYRRIKLDTLPFFDLMTRVPHALNWVLAKRHLTIFHDGVLYEVVE